MAPSNVDGSLPAERHSHAALQTPDQAMLVTGPATWACPRGASSGHEFTLTSGQTGRDTGIVISISADGPDDTHSHAHIAQPVHQATHAPMLDQWIPQDPMPALSAGSEALQQLLSSADPSYYSPSTDFHASSMGYMSELNNSQPGISDHGMLMENMFPECRVKLIPDGASLQTPKDRPSTSDTQASSQGLASHSGGGSGLKQVSLHSAAKSAAMQMPSIGVAITQQEAGTSTPQQDDDASSSPTAEQPPTFGATLLPSMLFPEQQVSTALTSVSPLAGNPINALTSGGLSSVHDISSASNTAKSPSPASGSQSTLRMPTSPQQGTTAGNVSPDGNQHAPSMQSAGPFGINHEHLFSALASSRASIASVTSPNALSQKQLPSIHLDLVDFSMRSPFEATMPSPGPSTPPSSAPWDTSVDSRLNRQSTGDSRTPSPFANTYSPGGTMRSPFSRLVPTLDSSSDDDNMDGNSTSPATPRSAEVTASLGMGGNEQQAGPGSKQEQTGKDAGQLGANNQQQTSHEHSNNYSTPSTTHEIASLMHGVTGSMHSPFERHQSTLGMPVQASGRAADPNSVLHNPMQGNFAPSAGALSFGINPNIGQQGLGAHLTSPSIAALLAGLQGIPAGAGIATMPQQSPFLGIGTMHGPSNGVQILPNVNTRLATKGSGTIGKQGSQPSAQHAFPTGIVRRAHHGSGAARALVLIPALQRLVTVTGSNGLLMYSTRTTSENSLALPPRIASLAANENTTFATRSFRSQSFKLGRKTATPSQSWAARQRSVLVSPASFSLTANPSTASTLFPNVSGLQYSNSIPISTQSSGGVSAELRVVPLLAGSSVTCEPSNAAARALLAPEVTAVAASHGAGTYLIWTGHADGSVRVWAAKGSTTPICIRKVGNQAITTLCVADDAAKGTAGEGHLLWLCDAVGCTASLAWKGNRTEDGSSQPHSPVIVMHPLTAVLPGADAGVADAADAANMGQPSFLGNLVCGAAHAKPPAQTQSWSMTSRSKWPASCVAMLAKQGIVVAATHGMLLHVMQASSHVLSHSAGFKSYGACVALSHMRWGTAVPQPSARRRSSGNFRAMDTNALMTQSFNGPAPPLPPVPLQPRRGAHASHAWRLLSAHAEGTILLWDLSHGRAEILCSVTSVSSLARVSGMAVAASLDVLVTSHKDGSLCLWPLPNAPMAPQKETGVDTSLKSTSNVLPVIWSVTREEMRSDTSVTGRAASQSITQTSNNTNPGGNNNANPVLAPPASVSMPPTTGAATRFGSLTTSGNGSEAAAAARLLAISETRPGFGRPAALHETPAWRVRTWAMQAHNSGIISMAVSGSTVITASSAGGIKSWDLGGLCQQASAAGLVLIPSSHVPGQTHATGGNNSARATQYAMTAPGLTPFVPPQSHMHAGSMSMLGQTNAAFAAHTGVSAIHAPTVGSFHASRHGLPVQPATAPSGQISDPFPAVSQTGGRPGLPGYNSSHSSVQPPVTRAASPPLPMASSKSHNVRDAQRSLSPGLASSSNGGNSSEPSVGATTNANLNPLFTSQSGHAKTEASAQQTTSHPTHPILPTIMSESLQSSQEHLSEPQQNEQDAGNITTRLPVADPLPPASNNDSSPAGPNVAETTQPAQQATAAVTEVSTDGVASNLPKTQAETAHVTSHQGAERQQGVDIAVQSNVNPVSAVSGSSAIQRGAFATSSQEAMHLRTPVRQMQPSATPSNSPIIPAGTSNLIPGAHDGQTWASPVDGAPRAFGAFNVTGANRLLTFDGPPNPVPNVEAAAAARNAVNTVRRRSQGSDSFPGFAAAPAGPDGTPANLDTTTVSNPAPQGSGTPQQQMLHRSPVLGHGSYMPANEVEYPQLQQAYVTPSNGGANKRRAMDPADNTYASSSPAPGLPYTAYQGFSHGTNQAGPQVWVNKSEVADGEEIVSFGGAALPTMENNSQLIRSPIDRWWGAASDDNNETPETSPRASHASMLGLHGMSGISMSHARNVDSFSMMASRAASHPWMTGSIDAADMSRYQGFEASFGNPHSRPAASQSSSAGVDASTDMQLSAEARAAQQVREFSDKLAMMTGTGLVRGQTGDLGASPAKTLSAYADKFIKKDDVRMVEEVGRGAEGSVWRGRWHHIDVAVKEMHPKSTSFNRLATLARDMKSGSGTDVLDAVLQEVQTLVDVSQHPNIVRFIGVCMDPPRIITEYYPRGSLFHLLGQARDGDLRVIRSLSWPRRLQMLHDVAAGMAYLHSRNYTHGDLRTPNIFVASDGHVKIGDFGFARLMGESEDKVTSRTTNPRWLAPEVLRTGKSSRASDVFSFAIIMWEMLTWQVPYTGYFSVQVTFNHVRDDFRPDIPAPDQLPVSKHVNTAPYQALMKACWAQDCAGRPTFSEVAARLSALMHWQHSLANEHDRDRQRVRAKRSSASGSGAGVSVARQVLGRDSPRRYSPSHTSALNAASGSNASGAQDSPRGGNRLETLRAAEGASWAPSPTGRTSNATYVARRERSRSTHRTVVGSSLTSPGNRPGSNYPPGFVKGVEDEGLPPGIRAAQSLHKRATRIHRAAAAAVSAVDREGHQAASPHTPGGNQSGWVPSARSARFRMFRENTFGATVSRNNSMRDREAAFVAPALPALALTTSITPAATEWLTAAITMHQAARESQQPRSPSASSNHTSPAVSPRHAAAALAAQPMLPPPPQQIPNSARSSAAPSPTGRSYPNVRAPSPLSRAGRPPRPPTSNPISPSTSTLALAQEDNTTVSTVEQVRPRSAETASTYAESSPESTDFPTPDPVILGPPPHAPTHMPAQMVAKFAHHTSPPAPPLQLPTSSSPEPPTSNELMFTHETTSPLPSPSRAGSQPLAPHVLDEAQSGAFDHHPDPTTPPLQDLVAADASSMAATVAASARPIDIMRPVPEVHNFGEMQMPVSPPRSLKAASPINVALPTTDMLATHMQASGIPQFTTGSPLNKHRAALVEVGMPATSTSPPLRAGSVHSQVVSMAQDVDHEQQVTGWWAVANNTVNNNSKVVGSGRRSNPGSNVPSRNSSIGLAEAALLDIPGHLFPRSPVERTGSAVLHSNSRSSFERGSSPEVMMHQISRGSLDRQASPEGVYIQQQQQQLQPPRASFERQSFLEQAVLQSVSRQSLDRQPISPAVVLTAQNMEHVPIQPPMQYPPWHHAESLPPANTLQSAQMPPAPVITASVAEPFRLPPAIPESDGDTSSGVPQLGLHKKPSVTAIPGHVLEKQMNLQGPNSSVGSSGSHTQWSRSMSFAALTGKLSLQREASSQATTQLSNRDSAGGIQYTSIGSTSSVTAPYQDANNAVVTVTIPDVPPVPRHTATTFFAVQSGTSDVQTQQQAPSFPSSVNAHYSMQGSSVFSHHQQSVTQQGLPSVIENFQSHEQQQLHTDAANTLRQSSFASQAVQQALAQAVQSAFIQNDM